MVCLSLPLDDKMFRVHEFHWWEVLSVSSSFCTVRGKPDPQRGGSSGPEPGPSHQPHQPRQPALLTYLPWIHCPVSSQFSPPNLLSSFSSCPDLLCPYSLSTVPPIFHPVGSLSSTSQAESCGLTSTWKALFGLESPLLTCLPSLVWQGRSEFHRNETSWNVPEEPPGWKAPRHMQSSQVSLVALYSSRYQKKMLPISKAVTKMGPRKAQPLSSL